MQATLSLSLFMLNDSLNQLFLFAFCGQTAVFQDILHRKQESTHHNMSRAAALFAFAR